MNKEQGSYCNMFIQLALMIQFIKKKNKVNEN